MACPASWCFNDNVVLGGHRRRHAIRSCSGVRDGGVNRGGGCTALITRLPSASSWRCASAHRRRRRHGGTTTVISATSDDDADGPANARAADLLVEVSTGGQQQRRWARSSDGGFERLPPTRQSRADVAAGAAARDEDDGWSWDIRQSPRLRAIFLPAGQGQTQLCIHDNRLAFLSRQCVRFVASYKHTHTRTRLIFSVFFFPNKTPLADMNRDDVHVCVLRLCRRVPRHCEPGLRAFHSLASR